jgi:hypothetical protein
MCQLCVDEIGLGISFIHRFEQETEKPRGAVLSKERADLRVQIVIASQPPVAVVAV